MHARCQYCGRETIDGRDFCSADCEEQYQAAKGTTLTDVKRLLIGFAVSLLIILFGPATGNQPMVGIGVAILGFFIAKWPMATPETVDAVGYIPSHEICRAIGVTIVPVGLFMTLMM